MFTFYTASFKEHSTLISRAVKSSVNSNMLLHFASGKGVCYTKNFILALDILPVSGDLPESSIEVDIPMFLSLCREYDSLSFDGKMFSHGQDKFSIPTKKAGNALPFKMQEMQNDVNLPVRWKGKATSQFTDVLAKAARFVGDEVNDAGFHMIYLHSNTVVASDRTYFFKADMAPFNFETPCALSAEYVSFISAGDDLAISDKWLFLQGKGMQMACLNKADVDTLKLCLTPDFEKQYLHSTKVKLSLKAILESTKFLLSLDSMSSKKDRIIQLHLDPGRIILASAFGSQVFEGAFSESAFEAHEFSLDAKKLIDALSFLKQPNSDTVWLSFSPASRIFSLLDEFSKVSVAIAKLVQKGK